MRKTSLYVTASMARRLHKLGFKEHTHFTWKGGKLWKFPAPTVGELIQLFMDKGYNVVCGYKVVVAKDGNTYYRPAGKHLPDTLALLYIEVFL